MDNPTNNKAVKAVDKIAELGRLKNVYERCCYYDDRVCTGAVSYTHLEYKEKAHRELCRVRDEQKTIGKIKVNTELK